MKRLTLALCVVGLLSGCSNSDSTVTGDKASKEYITPKPVKEVMAPTKAVEDFLKGTYGADVEIVGSPKEQAGTYQQSPAVFVYAEWKMKGDSDPRHKLYLVQEGRVKREGNYDPGKSMDANIASFEKTTASPAVPPTKRKKK